MSRTTNEPADSTTKRAPLDGAAALARLALIGAVLLVVVGAFGYVGGWFSPNRLTQDRMMDAFAVDRRRPPGLSPQSCQGAVRHRLVREQRQRGCSVESGDFRRGPRAPDRPLRSGGRHALAGRHAGDGAQHGAALPPGRRPGMAHRHERHPGVCGQFGPGLLRAAARLQARSRRAANPIPRRCRIFWLVIRRRCAPWPSSGARRLLGLRRFHVQQPGRLSHGQCRRSLGSRAMGHGAGAGVRGRQRRRSAADADKNYLFDELDCARSNGSRCNGTW